MGKPAHGHVTRQPKELWLVPGATHVDLFGFAQREYARRVLAFVEKSETQP